MNSLIKSGFIYLLCLDLILCLVAFSVPSFSDYDQQTKPPTTTEIRGVWLTNVASGVLFVPWGIDRALNQLSALNFNTVYPVVWNRGETFYKSAVAQSVIGSDAQPVLTLIHGGQDVLAKIVKLAKPKGLSVIPWFEYGFMTPANSELARRYPDWLTNGQQGVKSVQETPPEEADNGSTNKQAWLNPLHPEVQKFILGMIVEVVKNYDVEGVQLDDHFGMPVQFGYDPFTIDLYRQEHQGKSPPSNQFNSEWMRWRANKITDFMAEIYQAVKAVKPKAKISLSPNSHAFAYKYYLQDWESWVKKGLVDELILQVYRNNKNSFIADLEKPAVELARTQIPVAIGISTGTLRNPVEIAQVREQVQIVRDRSFVGISFFYWESLWGYIAPESPRQRRSVFQEMFTDKAARPSRPKKI
ncbi:glycoside hydrolase family 10 protein [Nostocaceae cyanobacterium CENA357]|uniref:Glycoside hydrolase family 10 protein n=1 Tax=Atlanticothrix silvestris CENA357 TaxID=1725252 RepID=A0A8J7HJJ8_9CYAN|nr:glycoside hydrolase family 10 protein [Atlanticothrix silvestris]MBH8556379.1 glycoside hydrolase family 10 protein [Atlanticothrix silvestris CENA357]